MLNPPHHPLLQPPSAPFSSLTPSPGFTVAPRRQFRPPASSEAWTETSLSLKLLTWKVGTADAPASRLLAKTQQDLAGEWLSLRLLHIKDSINIS